MRAWAEATDPGARAQGMRVHAVCPGYIRTPMTERNAFPMPLLMSAEDAAHRMLRGIARDRVRIAYPWPLYAAARLLGALPPRWIGALMGRFPAKAQGTQ